MGKYLDVSQKSMHHAPCSRIQRSVSRKLREILYPQLGLFYTGSESNRSFKTSFICQFYQWTTSCFFFQKSSSDEVNFELRGHVNEENSCVWDGENPRIQHCLLDIMVSWYNWTLFFGNAAVTVNNVRIFVPWINEYSSRGIWFQ